jgi:hypothetical protein
MRWYDRRLRRFQPFHPFSGKKRKRALGDKENIKREYIKSIPPYGVKWVE